jgi:DNA polymerase III alpha subunit (gram-positive type)
MPASRSNPPNDLPLIEVTFCVLDIETTGGSAKSDQITEIAVVKVRGGEIQGQFQTLVNPGIEIPLMIESLTGIKNFRSFAIFLRVCTRFGVGSTQRQF